MAEWTPLFFGLSIILVVGFAFPLILQDFVDVEEYDHDSFLSPLIENINEGITLFGFTINPFDIFGDTIKDFLVTQLIVLSMIPPIFAIPMIVIILFGFVYTIIKLLPTT